MICATVLPVSAPDFVKGRLQLFLSCLYRGRNRSVVMRCHCQHGSGLCVTSDGRRTARVSKRCGPVHAFVFGAKTYRRTQQC
jgi:hypothetical protein